MVALRVAFAVSLLQLHGSLAEECFENKPWTDYEDLHAIRAKCPGIGSEAWGANPRFDEPKGCESDAIVHELAHAIANDGFDCSKWCVFSLQTDTAWLWNAGESCWTGSEGCNAAVQEKEAAKSLAKSLCPASSCTPLRPASELSLTVVQGKCPHHHETSLPPFQKAAACAGDDDDDDSLALALANGMYMECTHWCVYSMRSFSAQGPTVAWMWSPDTACWKREDATCLKSANEVQHAISVRDSLCSRPCTDPVPGSALSKELITTPSMCPDYDPQDGTPTLHAANACNGNNRDELSEALANKAFNGCGSWCVFSLRSPIDLVWQWNPEGNCWHESTACAQLEEELNHAIEVASDLCLEAPPASCDPVPEPEVVDEGKGWIKVIKHAPGDKPYWYNTESGENSFEMPADLEPEVIDEGGGWIKVTKHGPSDQPYWYNHETGESTFTRPEHLGL